MVEPEVAFIDLDDLLKLAEDFVSTIAARVLADNRSELEFLGADIPALERIKPPFYRLTYTQAVEILKGPKAREYLAGELESLKNAEAADREPDRRAPEAGGRADQAVAEGQDRRRGDRAATASWKS